MKQLNFMSDLRHLYPGPIRYKTFAKLNMIVPTGVLLFGPPGCGKTLLGQAIIKKAGINFIYVKGPELLSEYEGESERAVQACFERARNVAPSIIFFDEVESLCPKRSDAREGGPTTRVVYQMLTEMDGMEERSQVYILAATNRPEDIDPAILRPGHLGKILYVGLPSPEERVDILKIITKKMPLSPDLNLEEIGRSNKLSGYTGLDLKYLCRETAEIALEETVESVKFRVDPYECSVDPEPVPVDNRHFWKAIPKMRLWVPKTDRDHYERLIIKYMNFKHQYPC